MSNQNTRDSTRNHLEHVANEHIVASIEKLQSRQKRERPDSAEWFDLSETLAPLFAEMARRQVIAERAR